MHGETTREQELFEAALPIANLDERAAFLDRACDGDPELRSRVSKLLVAHVHSESFFQGCISDFAKAAQELPLGSSADSFKSLSEELIGTYVGRYKLLKTLGEGGCGVVYLAEQEEPVRRRVEIGRASCRERV